MSKEKKKKNGLKSLEKVEFDVPGKPVLVQEVLSKTGAPIMSKDGMVLVPPKMDSDAAVMNEAPPDTLASVKKAVKENIKKKVDALLDASVQDAERVLQGLQADGDIGSFRILPVGMPLSGEFESDRVQILQSGGVVKEIEVG